MTVQQLRNKLEQAKGERAEVRRNVSSLIEYIKNIQLGIEHHEQAREILRTVGLKTQQQLQYHIGDITSLALEAVFDDPYELVAEFVERRNKTECDLYFVREDEKMDPISASGGGAVDVASFALRNVAWTMGSPRTRNTIILDEPLRFLSEDLQERASQMIKELSTRLGIQFIIVTHEATLAQYADKVFNVSIRKGKSIIT